MEDRPECTGAYGSAEATEMFDTWKQRMKDSAISWIDTLTPDNAQTTPRPGEIPDLYTFFSVLQGLQTETRKLSRKTADSLARFSDMIERLATPPAVDGGADSRSWALALLGLADRTSRIIEQLDAPPRQRRLFPDSHWIAYHTAVSEAVRLLHAHITEMIGTMNIRRTATVGERFDPRTMTAIEARIDPTRPDNHVAEEVTAGYMLGETVIRLAEVIVTRNRLLE